MLFPDLHDRIAYRIERSVEFKRNPAHYFDLIWRPCTVKILMVADSFLYFSDEDFGLSDLIGIVKNENLSYVRFDISVAHRGSPTDARMGVGNPNITNRIKNFTFDSSFTAAGYDQVWLFAAERSRDPDHNGTWTDRLTDSELRVLMEFMDAGGGVFATGDHEDLGAAMGGFLPRVRQMRRWFFPEPGPNGEGLAPPFEGPGRFDTNRLGHDPGYQFNDQSDDIPQVIEPKLYSKHSPLIIGKYTFPHPVLCGPAGPIEVLPDHPHESQCTTAATPDATEDLNGKTFTEFKPAVDGGLRPLPEVIATSRVLGGHTTSGKTGTTLAREFGAISVYDGHRAGVGRIVADATWHHFINVNLTGDSTASGDKLIGFLASASGLDVYSQIKAYFLNIAQWIAPTPKISCMRNWGLLFAVWNHRLAEVFDPAVRMKTATVVDLVLIGRHARDAIDKFAGQCQSFEWTLDLVWAEIQLPYIDLGDPWRVPERIEQFEGRPKDPEAGDLLRLDWVGDAAVGGAILALREKIDPLDQESLDAFSEEGEEIVRHGAGQAVQLAVSFVQDSLAEIAKTTRSAKQK